jgi:PAS domain-containing protein
VIGVHDPLIQADDYLRKIIDAFPSAVFVIDHSFNIHDMNPAAAKLFGVDATVTLHRLCGDIMHCMYAIRSDQECGATEHCPDCVIQNSVEAARLGGKPHRKKYRMKIEKAGELVEITMLVSATPFEYNGDNLVLLILEDISEIVTLRALLPICASCKKIRNDENYWESVTDYLNKYADLEFTHSICPECAHRLYPDLDL